MPFDLTIAVEVLSFFIRGMTPLSAGSGNPSPADRHAPASAPADSDYMLLALFSLEDLPLSEPGHSNRCS